VRFCVAIPRRRLMPFSLTSCYMTRLKRWRRRETNAFHIIARGVYGTKSTAVIIPCAQGVSDIFRTIWIYAKSTKIPISCMTGMNMPTRLWTSHPDFTMSYQVVCHLVTVQYRITRSNLGHCCFTQELYLKMG